MKLYSVITTVKEFSGCKNVIFRWFRHAMPQGQRPYADLIKDYEPGDRDAIYAEMFLEELFTWDEARHLKTYLDQHHGQEGDDFYILCKEPEYALPFKVWGYFNLVGCTLIDNGDTYRHRLMIVSENDDGTIDAHMETNPEAAARERGRDAIACDGDFSPF